MADSNKMLASQFKDLVATIDQDSFTSNVERRKAAALASQLASRLEDPMERSHRLLVNAPYVIAAVKTLIDLDMFGKWHRAGRQPQTIEGLAAMTGAHSELLERLVRLLVVSGLLGTDGEYRYLFTEFAQNIAVDGYEHIWRFHTTVFQVCATGLPEYFKKTGYRSPTNEKDSFWAMKYGESFMEFHLARPEYLATLNGLMRMKNRDSIHWFSYYPIADLVKRCIPKGVLLVDIGGGTGSDISHLKDALPEKLERGQLVLQDLAPVIAAVPALDPAITTQAHDCRDEQPIKGAAAYYLHNFLHDWSEQDCKEILLRTREAMKPDYSRLLINENVLSLESAPTACALDLHMLAANAGAERTAAHWRRLLEDSNFSIIKIWRSPVTDESIIEAEPI